MFPAAARALTPPVSFRPRPTGSAPTRKFSGLHASPLVPFRIDEANLLRAPDPGPLPPLRVDEADLLFGEDLPPLDDALLLLLIGENAVGAVDVVDAVVIGWLDDVLPLSVICPRRTVSFPERARIGGPPIGLGWPVELRTREGARNDGSASGRRIPPRRTGARRRGRRVGELGVAADVDVMGLRKKKNEGTKNTQK